MKTLIPAGQISKYPLRGVVKDLYGCYLKTQAADADKNRSHTAIAFGLFGAFIDSCEIEDDKVVEQGTIEEFKGFLLIEVDANRGYAQAVYRRLCGGLQTTGSYMLSGPLSHDEDQNEKCCRAYLALKPNQEKLKYYANWSVESEDGEVMYLNLIDLFRCHGARVTGKFHKRYREYAATFTASALSSKLYMMNDIVRVLCMVVRCPSEYESLQNAWEVNVIFETIKHILYVEYQLAQPKRLKRKIFETKWSRYHYEIYSFLVDFELIATPAYEISKGVISEPVQASTKKNEEAAISDMEGIFTSIPLHISDESAAKFIHEQINADVQMVIDSCEDARKEILAAFEESKRLAGVGRVTGPDDSLEERRKLANRCATWEKFNYSKLDERSREDLYAERRALNPEVAMLSGSTLLPWLYLLVSEHPSITASWLIGYKLYDKAGNFIGLPNDGKTGDGDKPRRGPGLAQQTVYWTKKAREFFDEILMLTSQAREHLKANGDDNYRYLFLTANRMSTPRRKKNSVPPLCASNYNNSVLRKAVLARLTGRADAVEFLKRISLGSMRNSVAVKLYFETGSLSRVCEALGHKRLVPDLIERYVPKQIIRFFFNRWHRIFQTALTYKAVENRACMVQAIGIENETELNEFLKRYGLKPIPEHLLKGIYGHTGAAPSNSYAYEQVVFPITADTCSFILTVSKVVEQLKKDGRSVTEVAEHWWRTGKLLEIAVSLHLAGSISACTKDVVQVFRQGAPSQLLERTLMPILAAS